MRIECVKVHNYRNIDGITVELLSNVVDENIL